jgi:hypothetical protein
VVRVDHNGGVYAIATFALVALFTLIITRLATGVLMATGLPQPIARFQARSAYSSTGFTTVEAENVVNHPVRRKVAYWLMLIGSLGTPTLVVTVVLGFVAPGPGDTFERLLGLVAALLLVLLLLSSGPVTRWLEGLGHRYAGPRLLRALADEPEELLELGEGFVVSRIPFSETPGPEAVRSLRALREHITDVDVLGVRQDADDEPSYVAGTPTDISLVAGDSLIVHGPRQSIRRLTAAADGDPAGSAPSPA